MTAKFSLIS